MRCIIDTTWAVASVYVGGGEFVLLVLFFFRDTATTDIYTLSLHDALPISGSLRRDTMTSPSAMRCPRAAVIVWARSEEHTFELQSHSDLVCRLLLEKTKKRLRRSDE